MKVKERVCDLNRNTMKIVFLVFWTRSCDSFLMMEDIHEA